MPRVLISAGHTVMDPGAIKGDLREADLTRKIAPKIIPHLEKAGVEVKGVPLDLPMLQRLQWINNTGFTDAQGDILVEVHINDADGTKRGIEAWYLGEGANNSHKLAKVITDVLSENGYQNQGVRSEYEHELGSLTFLNRAAPAPVLLETLYMDNPQDIELLRSESEIEKLAKAIAIGILKYLGKDLEGKELPADQMPKFDDLKPFKKAEPSFDMTMDGDDFLDMPDVPATPAPTMPSLPAPAMSPAPAPSMPSMPSRPAGGFGGFGGGGFGGGNFGGGFGAPAMGGGPMGAGSGLMADREQRKEMIEKIYIKALGRKPNPSDLNYFLNTGITESDLVKKIMDSQEHLDLVKAKQELETLKKEHENQKGELTRARTKLNEQGELLKQMNGLIAHKNKAIAELESAVFAKHGVPSHVLRQTSADMAISGGDKNTPAAIKVPEGWKPKALRFLLKKLQ